MAVAGPRTEGVGSSGPLADAHRYGYEAGRFDGWDAGYARGLATGLDLGAARVLIHGPIPDLSPAYQEWKARAGAPPECRRQCGRCSACVRIDAIERNRRTYGQDDFPGTRQADGAGRRDAA